MEMHQLRYFLAVAEMGSFSRAAERCAVAQPSLSQQIAKLERELGTPLFDRLPRRAVLTEAGARLQAHAERILAEVDDARREVAESRGQVAGRLVVGAIPTVAPYLLPAALRRFAREHRQVELHVREEVTERLVEFLLAGTVEVGILGEPIDDHRLHVEPLVTEPLLLAVPSGHRLVERAQVGWDDVEGERFLVLEEMHCLGSQMLSFCHKHGAAQERHIVFRGNQLATILEMVDLGLGLSLVPEMAVRADDSPGRVYRELADEPPLRSVVAVWHLHRFRTQAAKVFVETLKVVADAAAGRE